MRRPLVFKLSHSVECNVAIPMRRSNGHSAALVGASMAPSRVVQLAMSTAIGHNVIIGGQRRIRHGYAPGSGVNSVEFSKRR